MSEQLMRMILSQTPMILSRVNREGVITLCEGLGYLGAQSGGAEFVGRNISELFSNSPEILEALGECMAGKPVGRMVSFQGRWFDARYFPEFEDGEVRAISGCALDITEQKRAEHELLRSHSAFERAVEGIARVGADGKYESVNAAYAKIKGIRAEELTGADWASLLHPDDRDKAMAAQKQMLRDGKAEIETRGLRKDGSSYIKRLQMVLIRNSERYDGFYCFAKDITEYRRMHIQLAQSDRLVALGTMAAGIAHEINNPLACVITNLGLIAEELRSAGFSPVLEEMLAEAQLGAERVKEIVRGLKAFSRSEDESLSLVDVHSVLESALSMATNEIRHRALVIRSYGKVPQVRANEGKLAQVFLNLLINAAHAIPEGHAEENAIRIVTSTGPEGEARIEIEDTGIGMTPAVMKRIFDPFFTTNPVGQGTGLGLPVCHGIIGSLGGTIAVVSEPGVGTTFTVSLPPSAEAAAVAHAPARNTDEPSSHLRGARILVIDDEAPLTEALRRVLARDHHVEATTSGKQGIELILNGDYDLIFCDLMMPDLTGMDVYEEVRRRRPGFESRFVFMTGGAFTSRSREFIERISNPKIDKPFEMKAIRALVSERMLAASRP